MAEQENAEAIQPAIPVGRVKKIMLLDKDVNRVTSEALFLVSCSAELFLKFLAEKTAEIAIEKKRKTVKAEYLTTAVKRHRPTSDFLLDSLLATSQPSDRPVTIRNRSRPVAEKPVPAGTRRIDAFFSKSRDEATPSAEKEGNQANTPKAPNNRSEQWMPVHSWLESLNKAEVVKSKEIYDWLSENPKVKEQLYSKYSRYHLMHYIQKCHSRMLKRLAKGKGVLHPNVKASVKTKDNGVKTDPGNSSTKALKDNDLNMSRRNEALQKYGILKELEDRLSVLLSKSRKVEDLKKVVSDGDITQTQASNIGSEEGRRSVCGESNSKDESVTATENLASDKS